MLKNLFTISQNDCQTKVPLNSVNIKAFINSLNRGDCLFVKTK